MSLTLQLNVSDITVVRLILFFFFSSVILFFRLSNHHFAFSFANFKCQDLLLFVKNILCLWKDAAWGMLMRCIDYYQPLSEAVPTDARLSALSER